MGAQCPGCQEAIANLHMASAILAIYATRLIEDIDAGRYAEAKHGAQLLLVSTMQRDITDDTENGEKE